MFHSRYLPINPFEDGTGRIVRLMVNFILNTNSSYLSNGDSS
nr:hypothetical protein [Alistipes shahii]